MTSQVMSYKEVKEFLKSIVPLVIKLNQMYWELDVHGKIVFNSGDVTVSISEEAIMSDRWLVTLS